MFDSEHFITNSLSLPNNFGFVMSDCGLQWSVVGGAKSGETQRNIYKNLCVFAVFAPLR
jgi:hypothetical protein